MVYEEKKRCYKVGKIYALRLEELELSKDGTRTIITEGTPVKIIKIENDKVIVKAANGNTFTFNKECLWEKMLDKSILSPFSILKQLLIYFSYLTHGLLQFLFITLAFLCILPLALGLAKNNYPFNPLSLVGLIPIFLLFFPIHICHEYVDCVDEETYTVIDPENRKELKMLLDEERKDT